MTISILITILIIAIIIDILFTRHVANNVDDNLMILKKQTNSIKYIKNRGLYNTDLLEFVVDNLKITLDFVYQHSNEEDKKEIENMLDKYKK